MFRKLFKKGSERVLSLILLSFFIINSFPNRAYAISLYSEGELKQIVYSNLSKLDNRVVSYKTQRGVFVNFRNLLITSLWIQFIHENGASLGSDQQDKRVNFSVEDKANYYNILVEKVNDLNRMSEDVGTSDVVKVSIPPAPSSYTNTYMNSLFTYVKEYLDGWFKTILSEYNNKSTDDDKNKYLESNKTTIASAYEVIVAVSQEYDFMSSVSITQDSLVNFNNEVKVLTDLLSNDEYKPIFDFAKLQLEKAVNVGGGVKINEVADADRRAEIVKMLTQIDDSGNYTDKVNTGYIALLASSSVYVPFKSKLGDDSFKYALDCIIEGQYKQELLDIYNDIAFRKKPLYYVSAKNTTYDMGDSYVNKYDEYTYSVEAKIATVGSLAELIRNGSEGALVTLEGAFQQSMEDSSSYSVFKGRVNGVNSGASPSDEEEYEETEDSNSNSNSSSNSNSNSSSSNSSSNSNSTSNGSSSNEQAYLPVPLLMSGLGLPNVSINLLNGYVNNLPYLAFWSNLGQSISNGWNNFTQGVSNAWNWITGSSNKDSNFSSGNTTTGNEDKSNIPSTTPNDSGSSNDSSSSNSSSSSDGGSNNSSSGDSSSNSGDSSNSTDSSSSNSSSNNSNSSSSETTISGSEVILRDTLNNPSDYTDPVLVFRRDGMGGINYVMLQNIFAEGNEGETGIDLDDNSLFSKILYVTPFGDIVTGDNTVIIPGSSNSTIYNTDEDVLYYPFTDGFMSTYPTVYSKDEFEVSSKDIGRRFFYLSKWDEYINNTFTGATIESPLELSIGLIKDTDKVGKEKLFNGTNVNTIETSIKDRSTGESYSIFEPKKKDFKSFHTGFVNADSYVYAINTNVLTSNGSAVPLYPYTNATGNDVKYRAQFIVVAYYNAMMEAEDGSISETPNDRLDLKHIRDNFIDAIEGKDSVVGFERSYQNEQSLVNSDSDGNIIFTKINSAIKNITNSFVNLFGDAPGMLGLRSATQDGFMGKVLYYTLQAFPFIAIFIVVILLATYTRQKLGLISSIFYTALGVFGIYVLVYFAPKYLADITNFIPNNGSNRLAFDSLILRQEVFNEKGSIVAEYSDFGKFSYAESSITLYNFTDEQLKEVCQEYGQDVQKILSGGSFVVDDSSGLFVQGYKLKMSLDKLFDGISIDGSINSISNFAVYGLEKKTYVDSVLDYYMPYSIIMEGLLEKLNNLSRVYLLTRSQLPYPNNISKDAFFMDSYVKSPIFISPRNPKDMDEDMDAVTESLIESYFMKTELGNEDFIGFYETLSKYIGSDRTSSDSNKVINTLWYQTMEQNGYFDEETGQQLISNLVAYVNNNTREFLVKNIDKLAYVSDETWVEVTSLYATMLFNTQVSTFYNKLYPERINYEELSVTDTLRPILTKDYNRFSQNSRDIVTYVNQEYGFLGTISLALIMALQGITSLILTYAIFIMYFLLILFVTIKLFIKRDTMKSTVTGFLKLYGVLVGVYFVNTWGLQILNNFDSSGLTLFFILMLSVVVSGFSSSVVFYTITGFSTLDFANDRSFSGMFKMVDKLTFGLLKGMTNSAKSMTNSLLARNVRVGNRTGMDKKINIIQNEYNTYEDGRNLDSYVKGYYGEHDYESTEDFYNRNVRYRRAARMSPRVKLDIEDDGDYLN